MEENKGYLLTGNKSECFGCEACTSVCQHSAIKMKEDDEGFKYPVIDTNLCVKCGMCESVCPYANMPEKHNEHQYVFGGYATDETTRDRSTSGGIFSILANEWSKGGNYVIFGAEAKGLDVFHNSIEDINDIDRIRKSKYSPSIIGQSYNKAKHYLKEGKRVMFSGTPCQIAALRNVLGKLQDAENLFTVEVVCEGFPSPIFLRKYCKTLTDKYGGSIELLDYRYKDGGRWDYEVMKIILKKEDGSCKTITKDRWFNPFWIFWAKRLMSRNSCEICPFRTPNRVADITLGDLWGVHKYCPDLYGNNKGATLTVCNTQKGKQLLDNCINELLGHELKLEDALVYQRPMRVIVPANPKRNDFMADLKELSVTELCKKWNGKESFGVLWKKYIFGKNSQIVKLYQIKNFFSKFI